VLSRQNEDVLPRKLQMLSSFRPISPIPLS